MEREEAIQVVRGLTETTYFDDRELEGLRTLIPELTESEDERIRKMCITAVNIAASTDGGLLHHEASECLAWLEEQKDKNCLACDQHLKGYLAGRKVTEEEKQKEQKPNFDTHWENGSMVCEQKKQKPVEWHPEPESLEALIYAIEGKWDMITPTSYLSRRLEDLYEGLVNTYNVNESLLNELPKAASEEDIEALRELKRKIDASMEQGAMEKPDYSGLNDLERAIHRGFLCAGVENVPVGIIKETAQDCLAHLPAEWSEEDEKMIERLITRLNWITYNTRTDGTSPNITFFDEIDWLKSLHPHPSWKPSEEQMEAFRSYIKDFQARAEAAVGGWNNFDVMIRLYEHLKKL